MLSNNPTAQQLLPMLILATHPLIPTAIPSYPLPSQLQSVPLSTFPVGPVDTVFQGYVVLIDNVPAHGNDYTLSSH